MRAIQMKMVMENPPPIPSTTLLHGKVWAQDLHKKLPIWIGGGGGRAGWKFTSESLLKKKR